MHTSSVEHQNNISQILSSEELSSLWNRHHCRTPSPAPDLARQIKEISSDIENHPELISFMIELVELETNAIKQRSKPDTSALNTLNELSDYLNNLAKDINLPEELELPEEQSLILEIISKHTGQNEFSPFSYIWNLTKNMTLHIAEDAKENPKSFTLLLAASLGILHFMNSNIGTSANIYIDPKATTITDLSFEKLDDLMSNPEAIDLTFNQQLLNMDLEPSCHDHLIQIMGQTSADFVANTLNAASLFPKHCSRVKDLAFNAQESLQAGYEAINSRLEFFISDPAQTLGALMLPDSVFKNAFETAANNTAEFIYAANTVENVVLHSIIFGSALASTMKLGTMKNDELQEIKDRSIEFTNRAITTRPLNYLLLCSGSAYAYISSSGITPDMVWLGAAGALAGEFIHKALNKKNAHKHTNRLCKNTTPKTTKIEETNFITTNTNNADEKHIVNEGQHPGGWSSYLKKPSTILISTATTAVTLDAKITGGAFSGACLGALGVSVPFIFYNIPEDAALHLIFGFSGAIAGVFCLGANKAFEKVKSVIRSKQNANEDQNYL